MTRDPHDQTNSDTMLSPRPDPWTDQQIDSAVMDEATAWLDTQLDQRTAGTQPQAGPTIEYPPPIAGTARLGLRRTVRAGARDMAVRAAPSLSLLLLFNVAVLVDGFLVARVFAVGFLLVVPGAVVSALSRTRPTDGAVRLALAVAASLMYVMSIAVAADIALANLGVGEPLARRPLLLLVNATLPVLVLLAARRREPLAVLFGTRLPTASQVLLALELALLPVLAAVGAQAVNHGRGSVLATVAMEASGVLLVGFVIIANRLPDWVAPAGLYAVAVSVIYSYALSGDRLYGWDIQQEYQAFSTTTEANAWFPVVDGDPYRAMLSVTALPTALARLSGMSGVSVFRVVYPLLFAMLPVLVYVVAKRWLPKIAALAAAGFVIVQLAFSQQIPAITRQEIALVFFGVLVAIAFDDALPVSYRRAVALLAGLALAVTHYSTAYVTSLALLGAWAVCGVIRLARRPSAQPQVLVSWVVLAIFGFTLVWNFGITDSSDNVTRFTQQVAERGPEFLPGRDGGSPVERWVSGNAPQRITGDEYARRVGLIYDATAPWLNGYPSEVLDEFPVAEARSPQVVGVIPQFRNLHASMLVIVAQGLVGLTALGVLIFAWQRRREWSSAHELAIVGVVLLAFVAAMRVSGVAAEAYNQERAQIHAAAVFSVGLASVLAWFLMRWRRFATCAIAGSLIIVFLASSGLAARLGGGAAPPNLVNAGDARERFAVTDEEIATVEWLAVNRHPDSLVYTDRYGKLRVWAAAVPIGGASLQDVLTPATLDRNAYVFASEANVVGGRARGAIGVEFAVYEFPKAFLDATKAAIYSTGSTVVYR